VYLRFEHMRGKLDASDLLREYALVRSAIAAMHVPHLDAFLAAWAGEGQGIAHTGPLRP
jgi:hypothetical protein